MCICTPEYIAPGAHSPNVVISIADIYLHFESTLSDNFGMQILHI